MSDREKQKVVLTIDDPFLGEREVDSMAALIRDQLKLLEHFERKGTSPNPERLREDIRAYQMILQQDDPEKAANEYFELMEKYERRWTKREVVTALGFWRDYDL